MLKNILCAVALAALAIPSAAAEDFDLNFEDACLRLDFHHTGSAETEILSIDRLYRQGVWAGPRSPLIDPFDYGSYLVEARDAATGELLFSKGFDSYFGEYRTTTAAAAGTMKTYHETVLLPFPRRPLQINFTARRREGMAVALAEFTIDPAAGEISTEPAAEAIVVDAHLGGPPSDVLDIAILGEGYTAAEIETFKADLARSATSLLGQPPFAANRDRISIRGVLAPSKESGCDEPARGVYRSTSLGASFNSLGSERYLLTEDNRALRDVAANVPYDAIVIMVNHDRYGGGGIYNLYCTFSAHSEWAAYLLLHEFGHSFAGLADEYYSSSVAYNDFYPPGFEPVQPNITALLDPEKLKWREMVAPGTELPTPWNKEAFDLADGAYQEERTGLNEAIAQAELSGATAAKIAELETQETRHAAAHATWTEQFLATGINAGVVGAFEGAGYAATGLYRPMLDCLMFSRRVQPYCTVCEGAVAEMIRRYSSPAP
jgi:hypothetical protein